MTLATITALINSKIRNKTPKVLKTEHADVEQAIVNEVFADYKNEIIEEGVDDLGNTIINVFSDPSTYHLDVNLSFKISGKSCNVTGELVINSTSTYSSQKLFSFINTLYQPKIASDSKILAFTMSGQVATLIRIGSSLHSINPLIPYTTYYIDATYEINN
jgi:hypothetical protein